MFINKTMFHCKHVNKFRKKPPTIFKINTVYKTQNYSAVYIRLEIKFLN